MKYPLTLLIIGLLSCIQLLLSGQETETRTLSSFTGIAISSSIDAKIMKGSENQVDISAKGVELDKITSDIRDGILKIGIEHNKSNYNWSKSNKVNVTITYTEVPSYISASSSADVICKDKIVTEELELKASSSADLEVQVEVYKLKGSASSSADLQISGTADEVKLSASSSADIMAKNLSAKNVKVSASSSGDVEITARESIKASASSGGDVTYYGNPSKKDVKKSSGGDVEHSH